MEQIAQALASVAKALQNPFSLILKTYTPTISALTNATSTGAAGYYISFGAFKLVFGTVGLAITGTNGHATFTLPTGFLTTALAYFPQTSIEGTQPYQYVSGDSFSTTGAAFYFNTSGNPAQLTVSFLIIGT